ncbi:IclR family transcriptional regulator [Microbispora sp. CA-102843]|uniref:IclR family transcriptional regulator n=1 Tax=Microbispora sp. CA-102843 TaxID=3239952 RepID=UPI003D8C4AAE
MAKAVEPAQPAEAAPPVRRGRRPRGGPAEASGTTVPAAARAMALFEIFARERRELTKSEVARLLDIPESSSSDLLNTLHELGYVSRTVTTRRFYPTGRLLAVAKSIAENDALSAFGTEASGLLAQRSGETACCAVLAGDRIKVLAVSQGRHRLRYVIGVGDTFTIHGTAIGKALLGGLDDYDMSRTLRLKALSRLTDGTKTEPRELEDEVRSHRELGWYQAVDEGTVGVSSFAVSGRIGDDVVGLGIIGPTDRVRSSQDELLKILHEVKDTVFGSAS